MYIGKSITFLYKNGRIEQGILLAETPYTYFVRHNQYSYFTVYKDELDSLQLCA
jgi:fructosamine-3-kinase